METETSAVPFLPARSSLRALREAASHCRGCPLYLRATQTVFGEGPTSARVILIGEQPGDSEDRTGHPFVGPAGHLLDQSLADAGIARDQVYVTNVVKHFNWEAKGKRRLHKKPGAREISACLPWLEKEIEALEPEVLVCLGATPAQALLGKQVRVTQQRGQVMTSPFAVKALVTVHPASILRQRSHEDRERERKRFTEDLQVVAGLLKAA
jgi:DNA polymerase